MAGFSVQQAKRIVADLFEPRPAVYWVDFLLSIAVGYAAGLVYLIWPPFSSRKRKAATSIISPVSASTPVLSISIAI